MRKLIAWVFNYSLDGFLAAEGSEFLDYCLGLGFDPANLEHQLEMYRTASAHIMGRSAYEGMARSLPGTDHPFAPILDAANKVVFSKTLTHADWVNTTIASGDTADEIARLREGDDGHIMVWGGVRMWRSLMDLDLIDELRFDVYPWIAGEGVRLFDDLPHHYELDLVSTTESSVSGMVEMHYRRAR